MTRSHQLLVLLLVSALSFGAALAEAKWVELFGGKDLDQWESVGDGLWSITPEGYLLGQRDPRKPPFQSPWFNGLKSKLNRSWLNTNFKVIMAQAWLYTRQEFSEYELQLEWWAPRPGNSGVSLCDPTRGQHAFGPKSDLRKTPSQVGYEVQINNGYADDHPSGSLYMIQKAEIGHQNDDDWNRFDIEVRRGWIRVKLNDALVAEHEMLPNRPKTGPIGLQLHDPQSIVMFRNIRIRKFEP